MVRSRLGLIGGLWPQAVIRCCSGCIVIRSDSRFKLVVCLELESLADFIGIKHLCRKTGESRNMDCDKGSSDDPISRAAVSKVYSNSRVGSVGSWAWHSGPPMECLAWLNPHQA